MATPADAWTKPCAVLGGIFGAAQKCTKKSLAMEAYTWNVSLYFLNRKPFLGS